MFIHTIFLYILTLVVAIIYRRHAYLVQRHVRNATIVLQVTIICLIWTYQKRKNQRYYCSTCVESHFLDNANNLEYISQCQTVKNKN